MKLFSKNRNKKNATALTDPLTVRMRLGDDFDPKNNADVQAIIDDVSADEAKKDGVVAIKDSWPFATWSSPKCWCKLNSANLSFHKLKHTGFFWIVIFFNPVVNGHV